MRMNSITKYHCVMKENFATSNLKRYNYTCNTFSDVISKLSEYFDPYFRLARMDKPSGSMLLMWPCLWCCSLASSPALQINLVSSTFSSGSTIFSITGDTTLLVIFSLGSFIMRSAGCIINDMWDSKYDRNVKRTHMRPLASGTLSYVQASQFLVLQLATALSILLYIPNFEYCIYWAGISLPLVITYPLMKRFINFPQLVLGITFNWGMFMAWAATHGYIDTRGLSVVIPLYVGGVAWTVIYDTLYAHQDKEDDEKIGLKSTALYFGDRTKEILHSLSIVAVGNWVIAGYNVGFIESYYYLGCGTAWGHLVWQVRTVNIYDQSNLAYRFNSNNVIGIIILFSCMGGNMGALYS